MRFAPFRLQIARLPLGMPRLPTIALAAIAMPTVASVTGCSPEAGEIARDAKPFDRIDERATVTMLGTEPFWNFKIAPGADGLIATYTALDRDEPAPFPVKRFAGNNGIGFNGTLERSDLQAAVTPGMCSDGMSDRTYPYTATVAVGGAVFEGCAFTDAQPFADGQAERDADDRD